MRLTSYRIISRTLPTSLRTSPRRFTTASTPPTSSPTTATPAPTQSVIPDITPIPITRETLERLHKLSALSPPAAGSQEEKELQEELAELVGLMDLVKQVELPQENIKNLLEELTDAVRVDESVAAWNESQEENLEKQIDGKKLLDGSPTRIGDYYSSALATKKQSQ